MNISYDYYRIFYYAAKYQGFTQAANILGSNQPNITRAIKNLEQALSCKLFLRSNQGVRLTPEGERLYAHISLAFAHIQAGETELAANQSLQSGVVTVAVSEIALHCCLLPALTVYRANYPGVRIRVFNNSSPQAIEVLKRGLADFAVVIEPQTRPKTLRQRRIMDVQEVLVAGQAYESLKKSPLTLADLTRYPLVALGPHTSTFEFYTQLFGAQGLGFRPDVEAATADQLMPMIRSGLGIGFVPERFAQDDILAGTVFALPLETAIPKRSICLLKQEGQPLSIAARELETMITAL